MKSYKYMNPLNMDSCTQRKEKIAFLHSKGWTYGLSITFL